MIYKNFKTAAGVTTNKVATKMTHPTEDVHTLCNIIVFPIQVMRTISMVN